MPPKGKPKSAAAKKKAKMLKLAQKTAAETGRDLQEVIAEMMPPPAVAKPKASAFAKSIIKKLGDQSISEVEKDTKEKQKVLQAQLAEAEAMMKAQQKQADEAKEEYEKAQKDIQAASAKELEAAAGYKAIVAKKAEVTAVVTAKRTELYEAQKKVAMMEVLAVNHAKMKALEETRKKAQEAAEAARRNMLEQKQREKDALEATRRALAETRAEQAKAAGKGKKRKVHPDEADTVPATLPDGTQAADID